MALEIVTWGSGSYIQQALTVLSTMAGSGEWTTLARIAGVLGLLWVMLAAFKHSQQGQPLQVNWAWLLGFGFVYIGLMTPKVDVAIVDRIQSGCSTAPPAVVTDVPIGVAAFGYVTSQLGEGVTNLYERYITIPGDQKYAQNGFLFGANMVRATANTRIMDSELSADTTQLMSHCVFPMISQGYLGLNEVSQSTDLWNTIANKLPNNRWVAKTDGTVMSCKELGNEITPKITGNSAAEIQNAAANNGQMMWPSCSASDAAARWLASAGGPTAQDMLGINQTAADLTRQAMTINAMKDALGQTAATTDNAALAQSIYTAQAEETQRNTYTMMGNLASRTVPVMRAVLEALIYALFPIIMIFMLTPAWLSVISNYIIVMMWIQLWPPLYAVLNSIMYWYGSEQSQRMAEMASGGSGLTMETIVSVGYANSDMVALAGYMAVSIPIIAYMMIRGGAMAGSMLASGLTAPMSGAATRSGTSMTDASMQSNSLSWDTSQVNTSTMNQAQLAPNMSAGSPEISSRNGYGGVSTSGTNFNSYDAGAAATSLGNVSPNAKSSVESGLQTQAQQAQQATFQSGQQFTSSMAGVYNSQKILNENIGSQEFQSQTGVDQNTATSYREAFDNRESMVKQFSEETGFSLTDSRQIIQTLSASASAGASFDLPGGSSLGVKLASDLADRDMSEQQIQEAGKKAEQVALSQGYQQSDTLIRDIGDKVGYSATGAYGDAYSGLTSGSVQEMRQHAETFAANLQRSESWSQALSRAESQGVEVGAKLDGAVFNVLSDRLGRDVTEKGISDLNSGQDTAESRAVMSGMQANAGAIAAQYYGIDPAPAPTNNVDGAYAGYSGRVPTADQAENFGWSQQGDIHVDAEAKGLTSVDRRVDEQEGILRSTAEKREDRAVEEIGPNAPPTELPKGFGASPEAYREGSAGRLHAINELNEAIDLISGMGTTDTPGESVSSFAGAREGARELFEWKGTPAQERANELAGGITEIKEQVYRDSPFRDDPVGNAGGSLYPSFEPRESSDAQPDTTARQDASDQPGIDPQEGRMDEDPREANKRLNDTNNPFTSGANMRSTR